MMNVEEILDSPLSSSSSSFSSSPFALPDEKRSYEEMFPGLFYAIKQKLNPNLFTISSVIFYGEQKVSQKLLHLIPQPHSAHEIVDYLATLGHPVCIEEALQKMIDVQPHTGVVIYVDQLSELVRDEILNARITYERAVEEASLAVKGEVDITPTVEMSQQRFNQVVSNSVPSTEAVQKSYIEVMDE